MSSNQSSARWSLTWVTAERRFLAGSTTKGQVTVKCSHMEAVEETRTTMTARRAASLPVQVSHTPACLCSWVIHLSVAGIVWHCFLTGSYDSHGEDHNERTAGEFSAWTRCDSIFTIRVYRMKLIFLSLVPSLLPLPQSGSRLCSTAGGAYHRVFETSPSLSTFVDCQVRLPVAV